MRFHPNRWLAAVSIGVLAALAFGLASLSARPSRRATKTKTPHQSSSATMPPAGMPPSTTHEIFSTFFIARQGYKSEILLQNLRLDAQLTVTPALLVSRGEVSLDPVTMPPHSTAVVDINAALLAHGLSDTQGAVVVHYEFPATGAINALVRSSDETHYLYLNSVAWGLEEFMGTTLDAVLWAPDDGTQGFISIVNTSKEPRRVRSSFVIEGRSEKQADIDIGPRQARLLPIDGLVARSRVTGAGIHMTFDGMPGDIMVQGTLLKEQNGFAKSIHFMDKSLHFPGTSLRSHFLLLGAQPPADGFPPGISFRSVVALRNIDSVPVEVTPTIRYLQDDFVKSVTLKPIALEAGQSRVIDFLEQQRSGFLPPDLNQGTLELTPNTSLNSVIGELFTFSEQGGGYASGSYFRAFPARGTESIWRTDGTFQTTIMLQNTAADEDQVTLKFFSDSSTYTKILKLPAGAITKINVKDLKLNVVPDQNGHLIPETYGTFSLTGAHGPRSALTFNVLIHSTSESDYIGDPGNPCVYLSGAGLFLDYSSNQMPFPIMEEYDYSDGSSVTGAAFGSSSSDGTYVQVQNNPNGDTATITPVDDQSHTVSVGTNVTVSYGCAGCTGFPGLPLPAQVKVPPRPRYVQVIYSATDTTCQGYSFREIRQYRVLDANGNPNFLPAMNIREHVSYNSNTCSFGFVDDSVWPVDSTGTQIGLDGISICCPISGACQMSLNQTFTVLGIPVLIKSEDGNTIGTHNVITSKCDTGVGIDPTVVITP